jgi:2-dehydro-3-deoxygalactonokinase
MSRSKKMPGEPLIGVRWGTAAIDAVLIRQNGHVIDSWHIDRILADTTREDIIRIVAGIASRWPVAADIWLAGMIGSAVGWRDIPHRSCPSSFADFTGVIIEKIGNSMCRMIPGLRYRTGTGDLDFMRGEEVLALGRLDSRSQPELLLCVPGMHGKWIQTDGEQIVGFHTAMTVELAKLVERHSSFAALFASPPTDCPTFRKAVKLGASGVSTARLLFGIRSGKLSGRLGDEDAASELWGILVGADIADAARLYRISGSMPPITVTGSEAVAALYLAAFDVLKMTASSCSSDELAGHGFAKLKQQEAFAHAA